MVVADIMLAVLHHHTDLDEGHPAVSYPTHWLEQRSEYFPVCGSTEHMRIHTTMTTASTIAPTLRSPKVRMRPFLSLVCDRCKVPVDVTTTQTRPTWIRLWGMAALRMRIAH